jgi:hypothetical protein
MTKWLLEVVVLFNNLNTIIHWDVIVFMNGDLQGMEKFSHKLVQDFFR